MTGVLGRGPTTRQILAVQGSPSQWRGGWVFIVLRTPETALEYLPPARAAGVCPTARSVPLTRSLGRFRRERRCRQGESLSS